MSTKQLAPTERSRQVMLAREATEARRRALSETTKARLVARLRLGDGPIDVEQEMLIDVAVISHLELQEISGEFLRGKAGTDAMTRLRFCRSELRRALAALHLAGDASEPDVPPPADTLAAWIQAQGPAASVPGSSPAAEPE